jgi:hypothetical protein
MIWKAIQRKGKRVRGREKGRKRKRGRERKGDSGEKRGK